MAARNEWEMRLGAGLTGKALCRGLRAAREAPSHQARVRPAQKKVSAILGWK